MASPAKPTGGFNLSFAATAPTASKAPAKQEDDDEEGGDDKQEEVPSNDVHFEPIVQLAHVETKTLEEDEETLFKIRAKLFRYENGTKEWKERGTGDVKLLQNKESKIIRLVMRRDKTMKVCANHIIRVDMDLQPNVGSDRAWVWNVAADFAEGEGRPETLAIRFANAENAKQFKEKFDESKAANSKLKESSSSSSVPPSPAKQPAAASASSSDAESDKVAEKLEKLKVEEPKADA